MDAVRLDGWTSVSDASAAHRGFVDVRRHEPGSARQFRPGGPRQFRGKCGDVGVSLFTGGAFDRSLLLRETIRGDWKRRMLCGPRVQGGKKLLRQEIGGNKAPEPGEIRFIASLDRRLPLQPGRFADGSPLPAASNPDGRDTIRFSIAKQRDDPARRERSVW